MASGALLGSTASPYGLYKSVVNMKTRVQYFSWSYVLPKQSYRVVTVLYGHHFSKSKSIKCVATAEWMPLFNGKLVIPLHIHIYFVNILEF